MDRHTAERLAKRIDAIEARRPETLPIIIFALVEPGDHGAVATGEQWRMTAGNVRKLAHARD